MSTEPKKSEPKKSMQDIAAEENAALITKETFKGDLMKLCLDEIKAAPDVWQKLSERAQMDLLDRLDRRLTEASERAVDIIAAKDHETVTASVVNVAFTEKVVKVALEMPARSGGAHTVADYVGDKVRVVIATADDLMNVDTAPEAAPDQPDLGLDDEAA